MLIPDAVCGFSWHNEQCQNCSGWSTIFSNANFRCNNLRHCSVHQQPYCKCAIKVLNRKRCLKFYKNWTHGVSWPFVFIRSKKGSPYKFSWPLGHGTGIEIFQACMSYNRFLFLLSAIRFDDKTTRIQRKTTDKLAAIRFILDEFVKNCKSTYCLSEFFNIDETLVPFRGRCGFFQYIIIFIFCNWVVTRWQWLFNTNTKHEIGLLLNLRREGYMRSM
jgi:hypothetical protein